MQASNLLKQLEIKDNLALINSDRLAYYAGLTIKEITNASYKYSDDYDFIINISEDGWFGKSIGIDQHFYHSIFRSIEEGKNIIRSANNGISAYIDSKGQIIKKIESTQKGVIEIDSYKKGSKTKNITAVIGPAISVKNYEVKKDFYKKFTRKDKTNHKFFKMGKEKLYFNLSSYVKSLILKSGVKKIEKIDVDTFDAKNKFFSARRSKSLNHADYGRNISIIMLN